MPALREVLGPAAQSRAIRVVSVDTGKASARSRQSLLFNWIAAYMYEGDAPLAERRAAALALDRDLLRDLLGAEELRELLDPGVLADVELELQCLADGRRARSADELHDVLRKVGDLTAAEVDLRCEGTARRRGSRELVDERRVIEIALGGETRSSPPRTRPAIATRSAARCRSGCRWRSPTRWRVRSRSSSAATPAPTARSSPPTSAARFGAPPERIAGALRRARGRRAGGPRRVPPRRGVSASGATSTCCVSCVAGRWPRCAARSSPSSRRPSPGSSRRGTAFPASGAGSRRSSRRSACCRARRSLRRRSRRDVLPVRVRGVPAGRCSTSCAPPARSCGSAPARSAPRDGRVRLCFADQLAAAGAPAGKPTSRPTGAAPRGASATLLTERVRASGASSARAAPGAHRRRAARRAVGPRVGG